MNRLWFPLSPAEHARIILQAREDNLLTDKDIVRFSCSLFEGGSQFAFSFNSPSLSVYRNSFETLRWICCGGKDPSQVFPVLKHQGDEFRCGQAWSGQHVAYRCETCGISDNSCMCVFCFDEKDHQGHVYRVYQSSAGGCCDCGDPLAWNANNFCKKHAVNQTKVLNETLVQNALLACRLMLPHFWRSLSRLFLRGLIYPEGVSSPASIQVALCFHHLLELSDVCQEFRVGIGMGFNLPMDVNDFAGALLAYGGEDCGLFQSHPISTTQLCLSVGCYLPHKMSKQMEMLFLKLLLDSQYKSQFQKDFVSSYFEFVRVLLHNNQNHQVSDQSHSRQEVNLAISYVHKVEYIASRRIDVFDACCEILDGVFCQLFHNEASCLEFVIPLFTTMFLIFASPVEPPVQLLYGSYSRIFAHLRQFTHFPQVARMIIEDDTLFALWCAVLAQSQLREPKVKTMGEIYPFYMMLEDVVSKPVCKSGEFPKELLKRRLKVLYDGVLLIPQSAPSSVYLPVTRFFFGMLRLQTENEERFPELAIRNAWAIQEMFKMEHPKHGNIGPLLAARYAKSFLLDDFNIVFDHFSFAWKFDEVEDWVRFLGAVALKPERHTLRRRIVHLLASRPNCTFSNLEHLLAEGESVQELNQWIAQVADQKEQFFHLKRESWKDVEFGGFYLFWTKKDEQAALNRYRLIFKVGEEVFPLTSYLFDTERPLHDLMRNEALFRTCLGVLMDPEPNANCKTMALLLLILRRNHLIADEEAVLLEEIHVEGVCPNVVQAAFSSSHPPPIVEADQSISAPIKKSKMAQDRALRMFQKKQKAFTHSQTDDDIIATTATESLHEESETCIFCKKEVSDEKESQLHLLMLKTFSSFSTSMQSLNWLGPASPCAVSTLEQDIPVAHPISTSNEMQERMAWFQKVKKLKAMPLLHTCHHAVHLSCLEHYRSSLFLRAQKNEHFEGRDIVALEANEILCPVCRRVSNETMPLYRSSRLKAEENDTSHSVSIKEWLHQRLTVVPPPTNHAFQGKNDEMDVIHAFLGKFECLAEVLVSQLECDAENAPRVVELVLNLVREEQKLRGGIDVEGWKRFLKTRFSGNSKQIMHVDCTLVFIEWMVLFPGSDSPIEQDKVFHFLLLFAQLQDTVWEAFWACQNEDELIETHSIKLLQRSADLLESNFAILTKDSQGLNSLDLERDMIKFVETRNPQLLNPYFPVCTLQPFLPTRTSFTFESRFRGLVKTFLGRELPLPLSSLETASLTRSGLYARALFSFFHEMNKSFVEEVFPAQFVSLAAMATQQYRMLLLPPRFAVPPSPQLIQLPPEYSSLTIAFLARQAICSTCKSKPIEGVICLLCGRLLCIGSVCCVHAMEESEDGRRLDEVFSHAKLNCARGKGATSSLFLLLDTGLVLVVLNERRFWMTGALYLDEHQEENHLLRKRLFLNENRLARLEQLQKTQTWLYEGKVLEAVRRMG